ncbi:hypothetical protein EXIGLDRAFT_763004 [Exidia glandulosa HHB12029]|uniref:glycogenin glucosyltransferase n=1 Tax=Exidia glandulosa HHB12029 TaxID=1314781 RepID=A0A165MAV2_EXIGL|nr:hypothetical protein EXIGLDRAFT_763004 [Exidia glandulosa HHB12029]
MAYAFVTLVTSDAYLPGALVVASALRDVHPSPPEPPEVAFQTVCLVTPETVDVKTIKLLRRAFDHVVGVEVISVGRTIGLDLLGRPDLETVLTKLHAFRLTQYDKIIFLDADVLPLRPLSHLFSLPHQFAAVPDVGWPDIFNSGVMVFSPGEDKFDQIMGVVNSKGSWDGGDQGVLNEWRGDDWHRLSFTYNTTPTAAYTYAPAYERFGSKISAIHFIGPNKPWASIPYRAPSSQQESHPSTSAPQSYAYSHLVDRWFNVYDKHFRPVDVADPQEHEVQKYISAWNESTDSLAAPEVLSLDALRRLAIEGVSASGIVGHAPAAAGEGEYHAMPLQGRVDLMRPQPPEEHSATVSIPDVVVQEATPHEHPHLQHLSTGLLASDYRDHTLPTPQPHEVPPAPLQRTYSLPPTSPAPSGHEHHQAPPQGHDLWSASESHGSGHHHQPSSPPRPSSPPKISWNPAVEPPPRTPPPASHLPVESYFPNAWDIPQSPPHHHRSAEEQRVHRDQQFFQAPPASQIPSQLLHQGHYSSVVADVAHPQPNRARVATVFPWEEQQRHAPARYFPRTDTPPPGLPYIDPTPAPVDPSPSTASRTFTSPPSSPPSHRSTHGMPLSMQYSNAWDTVPAIQKYANRLMRPPAPPPAPVVSDLAGSAGRHRRRRSEGYPVWDDVEESSRDGDVESDDEFSDSRSTLGELESTDSGNRSEMGSQTITSPTTSIAPSSLHARPGASTVPRSRRGSRTSGTSDKKQYKSQSAQTIPKETRDRGVQVTRNRKAQPPRLSPGSVPPVPPEIEQLKVPASEAQMSATPIGPAPGLPPPVSGNINFPGSGALSPRLHDSYAFGSLNYSIPKQTTHGSTSPPKPKVAAGGARSSPSTAPTSNSPPTPGQARPRLQTLPSEDIVLSPVSSGTPTSPIGDGQRALRRPTGRTWDPARGVDVFKKGSEEVLARFLRMDSWDESPPKRQSPPQSAV